MESPSYFAVIPASVRYSKALPPAAKLLYGEITALCNKEGYCWATNKYFADLYGVSSRQVTKWLSKLAIAGFIYIKIEKATKGREVVRFLYIMAESPGGVWNKSSIPIEQKFQENSTYNKHTNTGQRKSLAGKTMKKRTPGYSEDSPYFYKEPVVDVEGNPVKTPPNVRSAPPWDQESHFKEVLADKNAANADKLMIVFCMKKGWKFTNKAQFMNVVYRHKKTAKAIAELGYSLGQIKQALLTASKFEGWTLETVLKYLPDTTIND